MICEGFLFVWALLVMSLAIPTYRVWSVYRGALLYTAGPVVDDQKLRCQADFDGSARWDAMELTHSFNTMNLSAGL